MPTIFRKFKIQKSAGILADLTAKDTSPEFLRFNLIYGFNGSGKSTFSRLFSSLQLALPPPVGAFQLEMNDRKTVYGTPDKLTGLEKRVCVFNSDFIERHFKWAEGKASSIFYISEEQAEAAKQLGKVENELPVLKSGFEGALKFATECKKTFDVYKRERAKPIYAALHLGNRKYEAPQLQQDYENLPYGKNCILSSEQLLGYENVAKLDAPPPPLATCSIDVIELAKALDLARKHADTSVGEIVVEDLQQHPAMVNWVKEGHEYHSEKGLTSCLHCGQKISQERRTVLAAAFDDKLSSFINEIAAGNASFRLLMDSIGQCRKDLPEVASIGHSLHASFIEANALLTHALNDLRPVAVEAFRIYTERLAKPTALVSHTLPGVNTIKTICDGVKCAVDLINGVIEKHNEAFSNFSKHQAEARDAIKKHFLASGHEEYTKLKKSAASAEGDAAVAKQKLDDVNADIVRLRNIVRTHGPAATRISKLVAAYLGHSELTIEAAQEGYELHRHGRLVTGPPSEGEKTAIALCYFLTTLQEDGKKISDLIVVVDDPVSSLDTKAMNYACALILSSLQNVAQLFVLTHNQQCMNEIRKAWKPMWAPRNEKTAPTAKLFFVDVAVRAEGASRTSSIIDMPKLLSSYDSEYHFLCRKVFELEAARNAYYEYGFLMPNVIRRVLEVFLSFKQPGSGPIKDKLNSLCKDHKDLDKTRLVALERLSQVESHSDNLDDLISHSSMTIEETREANAALIHIMTIADKSHTNAMRSHCMN